MENEGQVIILKRLLGIKPNTKLAEFLSVNPSTITKLSSGELKWSDELIAKVNELLGALKPPMNIANSVWRDKAALFELVKDHPAYFGVARKPSSNPLEELHGRFLRLFIKPILPESDVLAVHTAEFIIKAGPSKEEAVIELRSFEEELKTYGVPLERSHERVPHGSVKVINSTIEIVIQYGSNGPDSHFLGRMPEIYLSHVKAFLMLNIDIKFYGRELAAQPMLFARIDENAELPQGPFPPTSQLYRSFRTFLKKCSFYDPRLFELMPLDLNDPKRRQALNAVLEEILQLQKGPKR